MVLKNPILEHLENESIEILRQTATALREPVMLYSIGKDSSVLLHLAREAFAPGPIPYPFDAHRYHLEVQGDDLVPR